MVFENRILRLILGHKRNENGEWRKVPQRELHSLYFSPNRVSVIKFRTFRWAGDVAIIKEAKSAFKISTGKRTGKRLLGRPKRRWKGIIRIVLKEIGMNTSNWVDSAQDRDYWRALVCLLVTCRKRDQKTGEEGK